MTKITRRSFIAATAASIASFSQVLAQSQVGLVDYMWSGALQPTSIRVNARTMHDSQRVRLVVSTRPDLQQASYSAYTSTAQHINNRVAALGLNNLRPNTQYNYGIEINGRLDTQRGRFHTPSIGPQSFRFGFASCAHTGSRHRVFETIRKLNPLFFLHMGDMHYGDIPTNERNKYRWGFGQVHSSPQQSALYRSVPLAYMWDDHDYGPNDSNKTFIGRSAARLSYQEAVPHYPLVAGQGNVPIYQAFTIGRVRFILTDTRSERDSHVISADNPQKSMLGLRQKNWLKNELRTANRNYPLIVWMCTSPWLANSPGSGIDNWNGFRAERRELANYIEQQQIKGLIYISGDLHALAIDDGSNNLYATSGRPAFPLMVAAALDQTPSSFQGVNYSLGQHPNGGQFGLMTVDDRGGSSVHVRLSGRNADNHEVTGLNFAPASVAIQPTVSTAPYTQLSVNKREIRLVASTATLQSVTTTLDVLGGAQQWQVIVKPDKSWLTITPKSGQAPTKIYITAAPQRLPIGVHATSIEIRDIAKRRSLWIVVKLVITSPQ